MTLVTGSMVTAGSDGTRLLTGTSDACGTSCAVADGPFVLTDARSLDGFNITWLVQVAAGLDCAGLCRVSGTAVPAGMPIAGLSANSFLQHQPASFTSNPAYPDHLSGARFFVAPGKRLCACFTPFVSGGSAVNWKAWWSGFVPYQ